MAYFTFITKRILLIFLFFFHFSAVFANPPANFAQAKKKAEILFQSHRSTLYCHCDYTAKKEIDLLSCQMQEAAARGRRASRVEYEHMLRRFSNML